VIKHRPISPAGRALVELIQKNRAASLGTYFRSLARASLTASAILGAAACGTTHTGNEDAGRITTDGGAVVDAGKLLDGGDDAGDDAGRPGTDAGRGSDGGQSEAPICEGGEWQAADGINAAATYDYLAVYGGVCGGCEPTSHVLDSDGEACATASDPAACMTELETSATLYYRHLVTTEGDTVERFSMPSELTTFLGAIDTPNEALIVLWQQGYDVVCGETTVRAESDGYEVVTTIMISDCPVMTERRRVHVSRSGVLTVRDSELLPGSGACIGRRPPGLRAAASAPSAGELACFFADVARLETSSITAFEQIARELEAFGAPAELVAQARVARDDEVRHAFTITEVARELGVEPEAPSIEQQALRDLYTFALDNAIEGCVRETFGALVGHHQAEAATDGKLRAIFEDIARDETRHAALSWRIAEWAEPRLSELERARIRQAQRRAIDELRAEMSVPRDAELHERAGLPTPRAALHLVTALEQTIWSA
jgi:hypothetical protein